ncbi:MAG: O-antigen ligase family protein [Gammaproteobacteria bacterium]|nr:O-antigen ligase family protein [Gammaproteobacteria bacterium]
MTIVYVAALLGLYSILMLRWPRTGTALLIAITLLWPAYIVLVWLSGPGINPQRLMIPVAIMVWSFHLLAIPAYRGQLVSIVGANRDIFLMIAAFFILGIFSGFLSPFDKGQAVRGSLNQIMLIPMLMVLVLTYFNKPASIHKLLILFVGIALVVQILGAVEWVRQEVLFREFVDPSSEFAENVLEGKIRLDKHRVTSVFDNPLSYAQFLVFMAPLIMFYRRKRVHPIWRSLAWFQLGVIPISVWSTGSRTGIVLILLSYFWGFVLWLRRCRMSKGLRTLAVSTLIASAGFAAAIVFLRLGTEGLLGGNESLEASTAARVYQLALGIPAIAESPIYGFGVHQGTNFLGGLTSIDNYYLTTVLEKGVVGLGLLLGVQIAVIWRLHRSSKYRSSGGLASLTELLMVAFVTLYLFEFTLSVVEVFSVTYIVLACFLLLNRIDEHSKLS